MSPVVKTTFVSQTSVVPAGTVTSFNKCGVVDPPDLTTSISAAATSISNVGPGLGDIIGPNGNFSNLSDFSKWILSLAMILGRLELFAVLVLFIPSFWRKY